ncbi:MAG: PLDc N-terminal domain-containing protein [Rhizobiaceae bacterium]
MHFSIATLFYVVLEAIGLYCAMLAIHRARTPQGSAAWVVFLVVLPIIAVPVFLFFGNFKFEDYLAGRRDSDVVISGLKDFQKQYPPRLTENARIYEALEKISDVPVVSGNDIELLIDGEQTFGTIFDAMQKAKSYILAQSYIINDDKVGQRLSDVLVERAQSGIKVRLIYDAVGCAKLSKKYLQSLKRGGVEVVNAHARGGPKSRFQINFRKHRKCTL